MSLFLVFASFAEIDLLLVHYFIYKSAVKFLGVANPSAITALKIGLGLLSASFLIASFAAYRYFNAISRVLYTAASGWLAFAYSLFFASLLLWLVFAVFKLVGTS